MRALGATVVTAQSQAAIAALQQAPCWSQSMQDCLENRANDYPNCALLRAAFLPGNDGAPVDAFIDKMKLCPEPTPGALTFGVALLGFAAGLFAAALVLRQSP